MKTEKIVAYGLMLAMFYAMLQFVSTGLNLAIMTKFFIGLVIATPMAWIFASTGGKFETWEAVLTGIITVLITEFITILLAGTIGFDLIWATLINSFVVGILLGATAKTISEEFKLK